MTTSLQFSSIPCHCGWRHQIDAFKPGTKVRVLSQSRQGEADWVGCVGTVREWSQYGGPVYVRVEFREQCEAVNCGAVHYTRHNFDPCELEEV